MRSLKGKTVVITGASRGIGEAIALRLAAEGANLVLAAKTVDDSAQKLKGTIHDVAEAVEAAGGKALALQVDVRDDAQVQDMLERAVARFGGIDAMINNAGAILLQPVEVMPIKRFDLLWQVNVRACYAAAHYCARYLRERGDEPTHIINMSPPISLKPHWIGGQTGYTITKFGMTLLAMGLAEELSDTNIIPCALWPRTGIATAAIEWIGGEDLMKQCRKPSIMADAVFELLSNPKREHAGKAMLDEEILRAAGVTDFDPYAVDPTQSLMTDFYVES
jgi:citronellol/citronellal dehydrogenase